MKAPFFAKAILLALTVTSVAAYGADFRAGAGKSEIRITSDMWPLNGFTAQHDPLMVRVLLMDDGKTRAAIVVIDQTSTNHGSIARAKARLMEVAGVPAENTIVVAAHTFSSPHNIFGSMIGINAGDEASAQSPGVPLYSKAIDDAMYAAIAQAKDSLQPAKVGFGVGVSDISVNRDFPTPRGWWLGGDAAGFSDKSLPVVRFDCMDGKPIAVLINQAVQSSITDHSVSSGGHRVASSDLAGATTRFVEQWYGGSTVAIFLYGAGGDQAPILQGDRYVLNRDGSTSQVDIHEAGFMLVDLLGERLGTETMQVSQGIKATASPTIEVRRETLKAPSQDRSQALPSGPVLSYTYETGPEIDVPVMLMRIGDIAIVGLQAELSASLGAQLKEHSPFPHTIVVCMVDGGNKYLTDTKGYDHFTYEARNSPYARGSGELLVSGIDNLLTQMYQFSTGKQSLPGN
jgi:neutral ceramidase